MKRITYLDVARGAAILLVVLGHSIQYAGPGFDDNLAYNFIYAVHMPLFMFLAGFTAALPANRPRGSIGARARQLLVTFLVWIPISYVAIRYIQRPEEGCPDFGHFLLQILRNPDAGGLWFLLVLFECHLLLLGITKLGASLKATIVLGAVALLVMNITVIVAPDLNWLGLGLLRWYFLFFIAGLVAARIGWTPPTARTSAAVCLAYLVLAAFWSRKGAVPVDLWLPHWQGARRQLAVQAYHALAAAVGIVGLMGVFSALANNAPRYLRKLESALTALGARSLQIYAGHYIFLYVAITLTASWQRDSAARILALFVVALVGSLALELCVDSLPRMRTLLYGR